MLKKIFLCLILFILVGCENFSFGLSASTKNSLNSSTHVLSNSQDSTNNKADSIKVSTSTHSSIGMPTSSSSSLSPIEDNNPKIIDFYASNDFHGRISEISSKNVPGISKLSTYLKNKKELNKEGFVYLNSGDYWQDTYESGYNKGRLLTECLDVMECETMSLGNHEFDWGIDVIRENRELTTYTKFLGANIRSYPNTNETVDFVEPYKIIERNGLNIGIIGAIGQDQITSITSSNWENITFLPHTNIVKNLSDELRLEKDCDIVILSIHADESVSDGYEITKTSPITNKKYVDAVFCAHTHQREVTYYNDVPFVQAGAHGQNLGHIQLQYDDGIVTSLVAEYEGYKEINKCESDSQIDSIIDKYFTSEFIVDRDKIHGTINGTGTIDSFYGGNILAKATYDLLQKQNIDVDIVINNGVRDEVYPGKMTSEMIFNMIPFTNKTLVAQEILGKDIINECVTYDNPYYMPDPTLEISSNKYYTVACIDYMLIHKNANRDYNYFPSYDPVNLIYTIEKYPNMIVEDYLQEHEIIYLSDFSGSNYSCLS